MERVAIEKQAIDVMLAVNAVITNQRLYPPTSSLVVNSMNRLIRTVKSVLEMIDRIEYAEAEKALLIQGEPIPEKELSKTHIKAFLGMMVDYGIKSICLHQGVTEQELSAFVKIFLRPPKDIESDGGLEKIVTDLQFAHIKIDEKVYVERDSDRRMISSMDLTDEAIVRFVMGEEAFSEATLEQVRELVKDTEWISNVFQAGVKQVMKEAGDFVADELSDRFAGMINVLSRISNRERSDISHAILSSLPKMENAPALTLLTQNLDTVFGQGGFNNFVENLDDDLFHHTLARIKELALSVSSDEGRSEQQVKAIHRAFQLMTASKKAAGLFTLDQLQSLKNEVVPAPEDQMAKGMDNAIEILMSKGNMPTVLALIERLGKLILNRDPKVRFNAARMMGKVDKQLEAANRMDQRLPISRQIAEWVKFETIISPEYEKIADQMEKLVRHLIENDQPGEAESILEAYYKIYTGQLPREKEMRLVAGKMLRNLATEDLLTLLISEIRIDGAKKQSEGIPALGMIGIVSIERLLNRLHDAQNRLERNRIIQALTAIGRFAAKPIVERILQNGPWYYQRNLILVLGRIGTKAHLGVLRDILEDEDPRVQREAVFAIQNIAGNNAGEILMKYLYSVDDDVKELIIVGLGAVKYQPAVAELVAMLDEKAPGKTRKARDDIRIKICEALGRIGDKEALPALKKIIRSKTFMAIKAHDPFVRAAAADAVAKLNQGDA